MNSFTTLQSVSFPSAIIALDLCKTMDLVVIVDTDGILSLLRTISWDLVFTIKINDKFSLSSNATSIKFNHSGKIVALGFDCGNVGVINLETQNCHVCKNFSSLKSITSVSWINFVGNRSNSYPTAIVEPYNINTFHLVENFGYSVIDESIHGSLSTINEFIISSSKSLLISIASNNLLSGFVYGVFCIFTVSLSPGVTRSICSIVCDINKFPIVVSSSSISECFYFLQSPFTSFHYDWIERIAFLQLDINRMVSTLFDFSTSSGRKWKDSTKVILPKLQLLKSAIATYELDLNPIEFLFTITQCGCWHDAVNNGLSSNWNDQGIERLRSNIDTTLSSIIKTLQVSGVAYCTNIILHSKELLNIIENECIKRFPDTLKNHLKNLIFSGKLLLQKLELTLLEARKTRDKMLLYVQVFLSFSFIENQ